MPEKQEIIGGPGAHLEPLHVPAPTPMSMLADALASGRDLATLEKFMDLHDRWERNIARQGFEEAMAKAAAAMPIINKNTQTSGGPSYKYADLAEIVSTVAPVLGKCGLHHRFETEAAPGKPITVTCIITHREGHSIRNTLSAAADTSGSKNSIQAMGSTITYLSKYTLMAALGLAASKDDDAQGHAPPQAAPNVMRKPQSQWTEEEIDESRARQGFANPPRPTQPARNAEQASYTEEWKAPTPASSSTNSGTATAANSETGTDTTDRPPPNLTLSIPEVMEIEREAKLAAGRGSEAFGEFWRKQANTLNKRKVVQGIGTDLRKMMSEADANIRAANPETGELDEQA